MIYPNSLLLNSSYKNTRNLIFDGLVDIVKLPDDVFEDVKVESIIFCSIKDYYSANTKAIIFSGNEKIIKIKDKNRIILDKTSWIYKKISIYDKNIFLLF